MKITHGQKQHTTHKTEQHISTPNLRKAQGDIARGPGLLNIHKHCHKATWNY